MDASSLTITQTRYLLSLLQKFKQEGAKPTSTLLAFGAQISVTDGVLLKDPKFYHQLVGSLQYFTLTHPNIAYAIKFVCQFMQSSREPHLVAAKCIFWYLKGILEMGLHFTSTVLHSLHAYCDAD